MGANAQTAVPAFTAGQVLTAQQQTEINTGIPVFATTVTRDAAFGGAGEKTLAEGQYAYIESTNQTLVYDGSNWISVGTTPGLVLVSASSFSAVSSVSLATNTFSATYRNYKVIFQMTTTGANVITLRTRTAGSDNTSGDYFQASSGLTGGGSANDVGQNNGTSITVLDLSTSATRTSSMSFDVISPLQSATLGTNFLGAVTAIIGGTGRIGRSFVGTYNGAGAVDSLSFISSVATDMTGVVRVYGYSES
jgi:hypothetical protein